MKPSLSVVIIGRNEGARLSRCLGSVRAATATLRDVEILYVDSQSTDDSVERARAFGARVLPLPAGPLAAARGRNAGWRAASAAAVLFLDGDTVLAPDFVGRALPLLQDDRLAVVCGQRRELHPRASLYQLVLDLDWIGPVGDTEACGGDALIRRTALEEVLGYDEALIAGEEPELCARLRQRGYRIHRLDTVITWHDLAMTRWRQYWSRAVRTGHAYAEVSARLRHTSTPLWRAEARRNAMHALGLVGVVVGAALLSGVAGTVVPVAAAAGLLGALVLRTARRWRRKSGDASTSLIYGLHSHLQQLPIFWGQLTYWSHRLRGRRRPLIEYHGGGSR